jgi:hypothetical protein
MRRHKRVVTEIHDGLDQNMQKMVAQVKTENAALEFGRKSKEMISNMEDSTSATSYLRSSNLIEKVVKANKESENDAGDVHEF